MAQWVTDVADTTYGNSEWMKMVNWAKMGTFQAMVWLGARLWQYVSDHCSIVPQSLDNIHTPPPLPAPHPLSTSHLSVRHSIREITSTFIFALFRIRLMHFGFWEKSSLRFMPNPFASSVIIPGFFMYGYTCSEDHTESESFFHRLTWGWIYRKTF